MSKSASKKDRQKERTTRVLVAASKVLNIGMGARARDGTQTDIVDYIRANNGMQRAVDALFDCLQAERTYYDLYSKSMVTEPDYSSRIMAARTLIANEFGEPIKRQQILIGAVESEDQLKEKLLSSPALCERVLSMLSEVKARMDAVEPKNALDARTAKDDK